MAILDLGLINQGKRDQTTCFGSSSMNQSSVLPSVGFGEQEKPLKRDHEADHQGWRKLRRVLYDLSEEFFCIVFPVDQADDPSVCQTLFEKEF